MLHYYQDTTLSPEEVYRTDQWDITERPEQSNVILISKGHHPDWLKQFLAKNPQHPVIRINANASHRIYELALGNAKSWLKRLKALPSRQLDLLSSNPYVAIATYAWMRDNLIKVKLDSAFNLGFEYGLESIVPDLQHHFSIMLEEGWLSEEVFDMAYPCPKCTSIQVLLRDTCTHCHSADIENNVLIHHFSCSYQASESEFLRNSDMSLVCPKCHLALVNFGVDYDKPGHIVHCAACQNDHHDSRVRGRCLTCHYSFHVDDTQRKPLSNYYLTPLGQRLLQEGQLAIMTEQLEVSQVLNYKHWRNLLHWINEIDSWSAQVFVLTFQNALDYETLITSLIHRLPTSFLTSKMPRTFKVFCLIPEGKDDAFNEAWTDWQESLSQESQSKLKWEIVNAKDVLALIQQEENAASS